MSRQNKTILEQCFVLEEKPLQDQSKGRNMVSIIVIIVVTRRRHCRSRHRELLTGSRGRLTILAVVAEEVDIVTDVGRS